MEPEIILNLELEKEISRLRAALEKYGDKSNWAPTHDDRGGLTGEYILEFFDDEGNCQAHYEFEPWLLAQEALKDEH